MGTAARKISSAESYAPASGHDAAKKLHEARRGTRQAEVTQALADQLLEGLSILLQGFEKAADQDGADLETQFDPERRTDGIYQGLLTVLLRLVFALYVEDRRLLTVDHPPDCAQLTVLGLFEQLQSDADQFPNSMDARYGAWDRILALFRSIYGGVEHDHLHQNACSGDIFDPTKFGFLESWREYAADDTRPSPSIDDKTVLSLLQRLLVLNGQRLSYASLDVEQLGSVYETLMGYQVLRLPARAVCLKPRGVWVMPEEIFAQTPAQRSKWLKTETGLTSAQCDKIAKACKQGEHALIQALDGLKFKNMGWCEARRFVIQPGEERKKTSSHYTPRSMSEPIVERTLRPLIATLGDTPSSELILKLKVCDPAMGSGVFLVAACRYLGDQVVAAWAREGVIGKIQATKGDPVNYARQLVAQHCLYGVDKNAYAVQLAKLSLWLLTMSADLPLTFVDHALRCGDSLVGLDLDQISGFHWKTGSQPIPLITKVVDAALEDALVLRTKALSLAQDGAHVDPRQQCRLLWEANDAMERVQLIGDLVIGAFFAKKKSSEREKERRRRLALVQAWLRADGPAPCELKAMQQELRATVEPLHWETEFVEVFHGHAKHVTGLGARMDAILGNPPFAGKNSLANACGPIYQAYLKAIHQGAHGNADYSAHFFRRADHLCGEHGTTGLIATNTICQGDTRTSGLQRLLKEGHLIYDAHRSMPWPGEAVVNVSVVHLAKGKVCAQVQEGVSIDGAPAKVINSRLLPSPERADPKALPENQGFAYVGSYVLGSGFILTPEERQRLLDKDPRNHERIFPYIGGKEVNTSPNQSHSRYVINFGAMSLKEAEQWPDLLDIVRQRVKPDRDKLKDNPDGRRRRKYWWLYGRATPALDQALQGLERCLVTAFVSNRTIFSFQPTDRVLAQTLYVFPTQSYCAFSCLQSGFHRAWVKLTSSSMKGDTRYTASDCFDTFPFPLGKPDAHDDRLQALGKRLYQARSEWMHENQKGLTQLYNALADPSVTTPQLRRIQALQDDIDATMMRLYQQAQGKAFCPNETTPSTDEMIELLFALNEQRSKGLLAKP